MDYGHITERHQKDQTAKWATACCLLILFIHTGLVAQALPITELFTETPLVYIDSPFHQYQMEVAIVLWRDSSLVGFDPWFAAGHTAGVHYNASAKFPAIMATALSPWASPVVAYKLFVFFSGSLAPSLVWLASRIFTLDRVATVFAVLFGMMLWWASALHWYHTAGMVSFVICAYAALPYSAYAIRSLIHPICTLRLLALGAAGALGVLVHPLFPIPVLFATLCLLIPYCRELRIKSLAVILFTVPAISALPNIPWFVETLRQPGWADGSLSPYQKVVDASIIAMEALGQINGASRGAKLNTLLWLLTVCLAFPAIHPKGRKVAIGLTISAITLIIFSAIGAANAFVSTLQPNRFSAAAYLFLVFPAAIALSGAIRGSASTGRFRGLSRLICVAALAGTLFVAGEVSNEASRADTPHYGRPAPEVRGPGGTTRWLSDWILENTSENSRILFETSLGRVHDDAHIAGHLVRVTQREFIGGPYVFMHYAGFWDGNVFGRPIGKFYPTEFEQKLNLYNIEWIIAHSKESRAYFDSLSSLRRIVAHGPVQIYRFLDPAKSFFHKGQGQITSRSVNRLALDQLAGDEVTLKYHWVDGVQADPPTELKPVRLGGDPQPFISLVAPPKSVVLTWR